jgi:hypothetical protein
VLSLTPGTLVARHEEGMFARNGVYRWWLAPDGGLGGSARIDQSHDLQDIVRRFVRLQRLMKTAYEREEGLFVTFL